ncbi:MAG: hypothetical protein V4615_12835 [Bacteroidota bacterium]
MNKIILIFLTFLLNPSTYAFQGLPQPDFTSVDYCTDSMLFNSFVSENFPAYSRYFKNVAATNKAGTYSTVKETRCEVVYDTVALCRLMGASINEPPANTADIYALFKPIITAMILKQMSNFNQGSPFNGGKTHIKINCVYRCGQPIKPVQDCTHSFSTM